MGFRREPSGGGVRSAITGYLRSADLSYVRTIRHMPLRRFPGAAPCRVPSLQEPETDRDIRGSDAAGCPSASACLSDSEYRATASSFQSKYPVIALAPQRTRHPPESTSLSSTRIPAKMPCISILFSPASVVREPLSVLTPAIGNVDVWRRNEGVVDRDTTGPIPKQCVHTFRIAGHVDGETLSMKARTSRTAHNRARPTDARRDHPRPAAVRKLPRLRGQRRDHARKRYTPHRPRDLSRKPMKQIPAHPRIRRRQHDGERMIPDDRLVHGVRGFLVRTGRTRRPRHRKRDRRTPREGDRCCTMSPEGSLMNPNLLPPLFPLPCSF